MARINKEQVEALCGEISDLAMHVAEMHDESSPQYAKLARISACAHSIQLEVQIVDPNDYE